MPHISTRALHGGGTGNGTGVRDVGGVIYDHCEYGGRLVKQELCGIF